MCPVREIPQILWATCTSVWPPTQQSSFSYSGGISCASASARCLLSYCPTAPSRAWLGPPGSIALAPPVMAQGLPVPAMSPAGPNRPSGPHHPTLRGGIIRGLMRPWPHRPWSRPRPAGPGPGPARPHLAHHPRRGPGLPWATASHPPRAPTCPRGGRSQRRPRHRTAHAHEGGPARQVGAAARGSVVG